MIRHNRDLKSHVSDGEPALSLDCIGWVEASRSPFSIDGDLAGTSVSFSPSVRTMRCSQVEQDVLRQAAAVLRYTPRLIRTKRAQQSTPFSGRTLDVLAPLHLVFADELDIHLLPKVGCAWMPKGTQLEVMTPGQNQKHYLAGALDLTTGTLHHCLGPRKTNALFRNLLTRLDERYPPGRYRRLSVVVDNYKIHKAKAVEQWLAAHPRVSLLFLPTYCPQANPIERAFGDVHDCCTRNHRRNRLPDLVADVEDHLDLNGPWRYKLSDLYYEPAVTTAVENITAKEQAKVAA
jgi:DDE superfamily endonuclease